MGLEKYIDHDEKIHLKFGISFQYMFFKTLSSVLLFSGLIFIAPKSDVILILFLVMLSLVLSYIWVIYLATAYFVTGNKMYKKTGVFWAKIIEAKKEEITDIIVQRGILERFIFNTGVIKMNTSGGPTIEMILPHVGAPHEKKKQITEIWGR